MYWHLQCRSWDFTLPELYFPLAYKHLSFCSVSTVLIQAFDVTANDENEHRKSFNFYMLRAELPT
jgi:hypothetical protein